MTTWLGVNNQNKPWSIETCKSSSSNHEEVQISIKKTQLGKSWDTLAGKDWNWYATK